MTPAQAAEYQPIAKKEFANRTAEREKAAAETARLQEICNYDIATSKWFWKKINTLTAERSELKAAVRDELYALGDAFALSDHVARIAKLDAEIQYLNSEYEHLVAVRMGANTLGLMDAHVNSRSAEYAELVAEATHARVSTIASLAAVMDGEDGAVSIIGGKTQALRNAADAKLREYEAAKTHAHDYRQKYEASLTARASQGGIITGANTRNVVAKF